MLGLRGRMAVTAVAASAAALLAVLFLAVPRLRVRAIEHTRQTLLAEARLLAHLVEEPLARGLPTAELDALLDEAAREMQAQATIIAPDGRVLADSAASGPALLNTENQLARPEIQAARGAGSGSAIRGNATVSEDLLYAAVAIGPAGQARGFSRVAVSLAAVEAQVGDFRRAVAAALLLSLVLTAAMSLLLSSPLAGALEDIMRAARQFAQGDLAARIRVERSDELGELARILNDTGRQLHERLQESARDRGRTDAMLAAMEDGVLAVDHRGTVLVANNTLRRNLDLQGPVGRHYLEVIRQREVGELVQEVLKTGARREVEVEIRHLKRIYAITAVAFPGAEGTPHGVVLTFHDVTERRHLDTVRRDFVANASHELRTPLTSIRGFVEALEDGAISEPPTAERFLGKIRTHADRMAALVEDLLELSRLESGERPPRWETVPPAEIAGDVVASFSGLASRKDITLARTDGDAPTVVTDAERLRRILENLVDNAIKYTPSGGRVEVRSGSGKGGALLEVIDNGPGIGSEHLPRIFERFYRVDKARSREMGGTGLGLAIVRHLAEGMGASVTVSSTLGQGTRFAIWVPPGSDHQPE